jgi:hypothetical protein
MADVLSRIFRLSVLGRAYTPKKLRAAILFASRAS